MPPLRPLQSKTKPLRKSPPRTTRPLLPAKLLLLRMPQIKTLLPETSLLKKALSRTLLPTHDVFLLNCYCKCTVGGRIGWCGGYGVWAVLSTDWVHQINIIIYSSSALLVCKLEWWVDMVFEHSCLRLKCTFGGRSGWWVGMAFLLNRCCKCTFGERSGW